MRGDRTREPQYRSLLMIRDVAGVARLGLMTNQVWYDDPRRLLFVLSRYKFVAKMLSGSRSVLEVGCADAFGTRIVLQETAELTAVDFDELFVQDVQERMQEPWTFECRLHDILEGPVEGTFDGIYALDVLEHIEPAQEERFIANVIAPLTDAGVCIFGSPSLHSQAYASSISRGGHVNCKQADDLKELLTRFFANVFIFSMNDEVVHTGFHPMAQYFLALCCSRRPSGARPGA